jgi:hypothetical protein
MSMRRQSTRVRKHAVADARWRLTSRTTDRIGAQVGAEWWTPSACGRARLKAELRDQAAEAVASYERPITRCPPKRAGCHDIRAVELLSPWLL